MNYKSKDKLGENHKKEAMQLSSKNEKYLSH